MKTHTFVLIGLVAALAVPGLAQNGPGPAAAPLPAVETPPRAFATAEEHYRFLLQQANGGTRHTLETIPQWPGLWTSGRNSMVDLFLDGGRGAGLGPGGKVRPASSRQPTRLISASGARRSRRMASSCSIAWPTVNIRAYRAGCGSPT